MLNEIEAPYAHNSMYYHYTMEYGGYDSTEKHKVQTVSGSLSVPNKVLQGEGGDSSSDGQEGGCTTRRRHGHCTISISTSGGSVGGLRAGGRAARGCVGGASSARASGGGRAGPSVPRILLE
jgi:hypothetical protein